MPLAQLIAERIALVTSACSQQDSLITILLKRRIPIKCERRFVRVAGKQIRTSEGRMKNPIANSGLVSDNSTASVTLKVRRTES